MAHRWVKRSGLVVLLVAAAVIGVIAFQSLRSPLATSIGLASPSPAPCSPAPCRNVQGYTLWVSNVSVHGNLVRMQVKFKNSSDSTHASPEDLQLIDSGKHASGLVTDSTSCNTWSRHEFSNGATFGPIEICFRVTNATPPLTLRWTPDFGFFCCEENLTIDLS
jgi:hypothetical protein